MHVCNSLRSADHCKPVVPRIAHHCLDKLRRLGDRTDLVKLITDKNFVAVQSPKAFADPIEILANIRTRVVRNAKEVGIFLQALVELARGAPYMLYGRIVHRLARSIENDVPIFLFTPESNQVRFSRCHRAKHRRYLALSKFNHKGRKI